MRRRYTYSKMACGLYRDNVINGHEHHLCKLCQFRATCAGETCVKTCSFIRRGPHRLVSEEGVQVERIVKAVM